MENILYRCRVCGLGADYHYWDDDGNPLYIICFCCGVTSGYQDIDHESTVEYRKQWLSKGAAWFRPKEKPENWSLEEQLKNIPEEWR